MIQSYRTEVVPVWIETRMQSVCDWAHGAGFSYEFVGDEIFDLLPDDYRRPPRAASGSNRLGRLLLIRRALKAVDRAMGGRGRFGFPRGLLMCPVIRATRSVGKFGCNQTVVILRPQMLSNAQRILLFRTRQRLLDFYIHACERIVGAASGQIPNQIVGTKLLTALHNMVDCCFWNGGHVQPLRSGTSPPAAVRQRLVCATKRPVLWRQQTCVPHCSAGRQMASC